jgi:hypothetical protein
MLRWLSLQLCYVVWLSLHGWLSLGQWLMLQLSFVVVIVAAVDASVVSVLLVIIAAVYRVVPVFQG